MASTFDPYAVAHVGCLTNRPETITVAYQATVFTKGVLMCVSGNTPLSAANPGENFKSHTPPINKCDISLCKVFIKGDAVAHELTVMDDAPDHKVDTGDDELDPTEFVTYVATGL